MEVSIPLLTATLIDLGIDGGNMSYIIKTGVILVNSGVKSTRIYNAVTKAMAAAPQIYCRYIL